MQNLRKKRTQLNISDSFIQTEKEEVKYERVLYSKKNTSMTRTYSQDENQVCLNLFNPLNEISYNFVVQNWTKVFSIKTL